MNRMTRTLLVIAALALTAGITSAQDVVGDLLGRINALRGTLGLPGYTLNSALSAAAQSQAQWMVDTGEISHSRPDGSTPRSRAINAGYPTTEVSENIYGGSNASADDAWVFWINSAIHYRGLTNSRYKEIGIGSARGEWGAAFVLVFGNPGGPEYVPPAVAGGAQSGGQSGPPSYVVGVDAHGNIMHEVQPDDTLGDIALIYGYTWEDIPTMVALNGLTEADYRELEVGSIFLVPPQDGTYTPTPGGAAETPIPPTEAPVEAVVEPTVTETPLPPQPTPTVLDIGIAGAVPDQLVVLQPTATVTLTPVDAAAVTPSLSPLVVAAAGTPGGAEFVTAGGPVIVRQPAQSPWLLAALVVQIGVLLAAAFEFIRRYRRRRR